MDSRRFVLIMAVLTAVFCGAMILYNFRTQPPYGQAALTVSAIPSGAGVSGTLPAPSSSAGQPGSSTATPAAAAPPLSSAAQSESAAPAQSSRAGRSSSAASVTASFPININTATAAELTALPGVGDVIAGRIVDYRNANGPFFSVDELDNVKGIGTAKLSKIRPCATVK